MTKDIGQIQDAFDQIPEEPNDSAKAINKSLDEQNSISLDEEHSKLKLRQKGRVFDWTQKVVNCYLWFVGGMLFFLSVGTLKLGDSVIITLLATTTATIIGLPYLIINSLFPKEKPEKNHKPKTLQ